MYCHQNVWDDCTININSENSGDHPDHKLMNIYKIVTWHHLWSIFMANLHDKFKQLIIFVFPFFLNHLYRYENIILSQFRSDILYAVFCFSLVFFK